MLHAQMHTSSLRIVLSWKPRNINHWFRQHNIKTILHVLTNGKAHIEPLEGILQKGFVQPLHDHFRTARLDGPVVLHGGQGRVVVHHQCRQVCFLLLKKSTWWYFDIYIWWGRNFLPSSWEGGERSSQTNPKVKIFFNETHTRNANNKTKQKARVPSGPAQKGPSSPHHWHRGRPSHPHHCHNLHKKHKQAKV